MGNCPFCLHDCRNNKTDITMTKNKNFIRQNRLDESKTNLNCPEPIRSDKKKVDYQKYPEYPEYPDFDEVTNNSNLKKKPILFKTKRIRI